MITVVSLMQLEEIFVDLRLNFSRKNNYLPCNLFIIRSTFAGGLRLFISSKILEHALPMRRQSLQDNPRSCRSVEAFTEEIRNTARIAIMEDRFLRFPILPYKSANSCSYICPHYSGRIALNQLPLDTQCVR